MTTTNDSGASTDEQETIDAATDTTGTATEQDTTDWRAHARKWEDRAKANAAAATELATLKKTHMSDQERAVEQAREEARTEASKTFGSRLVEAEVRAAASGRQVDVDALLDGLDRSRFIDKDGDVDRKKVSDWIARVAPNEGATRVDLGQGARGGKSAPDMNQLIRDRMR